MTINIEIPMATSLAIIRSLPYEKRGANNERQRGVYCMLFEIVPEECQDLRGNGLCLFLGPINDQHNSACERKTPKMGGSGWSSFSLCGLQWGRSQGSSHASCK